MLVLWDLFGIQKFLMKVLITLLTPIYQCVAFVFKIFIILATGNLLEEDAYNAMLTNFYVVLGIILLFFIAFSLLKAMANPDDLNKTTTNAKKIVINLVTSGIIMALLPTIFSLLYGFQDAVIVKQNVIGRFFGYGSTTSAENYEAGSKSIRTIENASYTLANGVWTAFFNVDPENEYCNSVYKNNPNASMSEKLRLCQDKITSSDVKSFPDGNDILKKNNGEIEPSDGEHSFTTTMKFVENTGSFGAYKIFAEEVVDDIVSMNFILALIAGILALWVGISYCFDMAVRLVKLVFYQLIAPIPIFLRVIPEGKANGMFNQWLKITLSCYFEVYLRIFVFYFCIYLCNKMLETDFLSTQIYEYGFFTGLFTQAFVIMGIIMFMKQAPKLIGEVTGIDTGKMKLGIKDKLAAGGAFTAGALVGGGATALTRNLTNKWGNKENWKNKDGKVTAGSILKNLSGGLISGAAGGVSGVARGGKSGWNAKSVTDMKNSASKGATDAVKARNKRANYKAAHGGTWGALGGHIKDFGKSVKDYAVDESIEGLTRESANMGKLASSYSAFNDGVEGLLEKEQAKGTGSVFLKEGFQYDANLQKAYQNFDIMANQRKAAQAAFNSGQTITYKYFDKNANAWIQATGKVDTSVLTKIDESYTNTRDDARDLLMNMALEGSKGKKYQGLTAKGQAALKDSLVNAQSLQATIVENANSSVVQSIMGATGTNTLKDIVAGKPIDVKAFNNKGTKLKDAAKVAQGQADIKIAEMNKEQAAKGDKK